MNTSNEQEGALLSVSGKQVDAASLQFMYDNNPTGGGQAYELRIPVAEIDEESLGYASFRTRENPTADETRHWMLWLGHIVSLMHDPESSEGDSWIANNIHTMDVDRQYITVSGVCSRWVSSCNR